MKFDRSMSREKTSSITGYSPVRWMISLVVCIDALGVTFACLAPPGDLQTASGILISCAAAIIIGTFCLRAFRNPVGSAFLPPLAVLAGAAFGILNVGKELRGDWLLIVGNIQSVGNQEIFFRFLTAFISIGTLGAFSTSRRVARGLSIFAVSGPGLLLLYMARREAIIHWQYAGIWKVQGIVIAGFLALLIVWGFLLRKTQALEKIHDVIGHRAIPRVLELRNPVAINRAFGLIDGWIDPRCRVEKIVQDLVDANTGYDRQKALSGTLGLLGKQSHVLSLWCRRKLEMTASDKPEAFIILAMDDLLRKQPERAVSRIEKLPGVILSDSTLHWIADETQKAFGSSMAAVPGMEGALQTVLAAGMVSVFAGHAADRQNALRHVMEQLDKLSKPLPESCRQKLEGIVDSRAEIAIVLAEDEFLRERPVEGLVRLAQMMGDLAAGANWLADAAFTAWDRHRPCADTKVQRALWDQVKAQTGTAQPALAALAMIALERGLSQQIIDSFGR